MSLLFGVKTVVDSNRGRLETCRGHVSTRGGLPAGRRIHLIYCLLTPWTHVHVEASKMSLTQTVTQMRIGLSVRLARRWSLRFPKRGVPLNCCSSLAASFFRPPSFCLFAMRHTRSCPAVLLDQHSVCITLGTLSVASLRYFPGEYHLWRWVFNFQGSVQSSYFY